MYYTPSEIQQRKQYMYNPEKTALRIRYYAAKQGMSGREIERNAQIGKGVFTSVEHGELRDVARLCKIADALHVDISKIIVNE